MEAIENNSKIDITESIESGIDIEINVKYKTETKGKVLKKINKVAPDIELDIFMLGIDNEGGTGYGEDAIYFANKVNPSESLILETEIERSKLSTKDIKKNNITEDVDKSAGLLRIDLAKLPEYIKNIRFGINVYNGVSRGYSMESIDKIEVVVKGAKVYEYTVDTKDMAGYYLIELGNVTCKENGEFILENRIIPTKHRTINEYAEDFTNSKEEI